MRSRVLGATGLAVSAVGFGGATIGFAETPDEDRFVALIRRALEGGVTFFDTAPDYRRSEDLLGEALAGADRSSVVLATKVGRTQTLVDGAWRARDDWSEHGIRDSIEGSLRRLRVQSLDLVQLHSPPRSIIQDGRARQVLERVRAEGLTHSIGLSADGDEARRALDAGGFETIQVSVSMLQQEPLQLAQEAAHRGLGVIAKQPLANGIPVLSERPNHPDWARKWEISERLDWPRHLARSAGEPDMEAECGTTSTLSATTEAGRGRRLELALRFLLSQASVATAIVGTASADHLEANLRAAAAGGLDPDLVRAIEHEYRVTSATLPPAQP